MTMKVNAERLRADLEHLATIGGAADGSVNRPAFSAADVEARRWYADRAREAGLTVRTDGLLNVILGDDSPTPAVWTGSHLDTVPHGGMFDGALGAVAALECLRRLHEEGVALARPVRGVAFSDEEGSYLGFLGSKGFAFGLDNLDGLGTEAVGTYRGHDGRTLADALSAAGGDLASASGAGLPEGSVHRFVELHIEQGPSLEASGTQIGVVTHIVGVGRIRVQFDGRPDHAGTTPMHLRRDALRAAASFIDRLAELPAESGYPTAVVTCGDLEVLPGASNVVPATAILHLDYRAGTEDAMGVLLDALVRTAHACGVVHGIFVECTPESTTVPVELAPALSTVITSTAEELEFTATAMASGAGHDSQVMARMAPTGMIFVPSRDGRSHSRLESTSWEDVANGADVLLNTLVTLAES